MKNTCGFFIYDKSNGRMLIGHSTNSGGLWSIPKGKQEDGEGIFNAALRELEEESNISSSFISKCQVFKLTPQNYKSRKKRLNAFLAICDKAPTDIKCISFFEDSHGNQRPELDKFEWATPEELRGREYNLHPTQYENVIQIINILKKIFPSGTF